MNIPRSFSYSVIAFAALIGLSASTAFADAAKEAEIVIPEHKPAFRKRRNPWNVEIGAAENDRLFGGSGRSAYLKSRKPVSKFEGSAIRCRDRLIRGQSRIADFHAVAAG